jgi:hypothetical protein
LVVVAGAADEFEIGPTPDRVPGLLFVPVSEEKPARTDSILTSVRSIKPQKSNVFFSSVLGGADVEQRDASWVGTRRP